MNWNEKAEKIGIGAGLAAKQSSFKAFKHDPQIQPIEGEVRRIADNHGEPFSKVYRAVKSGFNSVN
jgi:hypothetical protein